MRSSDVLMPALRLSVAACAATLLATAVHADAMAPDAQRQGELIHMVRQDCGSCHGLTLQGGLGPALTVEALRDKPAEGLVATVVGGRPGTPMPPFRGIVSEAEAAWIVEQLMAGFPEDAAARAAARARAANRNNKPEPRER